VITRRASVLAVLWCALVFASGGAEAATYVVTTGADAVGIDPGNGRCETAPGNGVCTLRRAIYEANRRTEASVVDLSAVPGGIVTLTIPDPSENALDETRGSLKINVPMTIIGSGPLLTTIDGNGLVTGTRVFTVRLAFTSGELSFIGLSIRNGKTRQDGGGIYQGGGSAAASTTLRNVILAGNSAWGYGGGVFGNVRIIDSTVENNVAGWSGGGVYTEAILSFGPTRITRSTVRGNAAVLNGGGLSGSPFMIESSTISENIAHGSGGGIDAAHNVWVVNSTITRNRARDSGGGLSMVAAVQALGFGPVMMVSSTVTENETDVDRNGFGTGGGVYVVPGGNFSATNTIFAGNRETVFSLGTSTWVSAPGECDGSIRSAGFNLLMLMDCAVVGPAPIVANPLLGPLQANGGRTPTHALLPGSPAIDAGDPAGCHDTSGALLLTDQRGYKRGVGLRCDIGAFEVGAAPAKGKPYDVDGDGRGDLIWRRRFTGENAAWLMNGATATSMGFLPTLADVNWTIVASDDVDGDGAADLVLQHVRGQVNVWLMQGMTVRRNITLPITIEPGSRLAGMGDLNGDQRADLVWETLSRRREIWFLDGESVQSLHVLPPAAGWTVVGVGDLDGDGKSDLVWRYPSLGFVGVWLMDGATVLAAEHLPTVAEGGWAVAAVADVSGDGKADLVWRHAVDGETAVWLLDGATIIDAGWLPTLADTGWQLARATDTDGDGRSDLVWRHQVTGQNAWWQMTGTTIGGGQFLPSVIDLAWEIR